jgi:uncharacterized DUF497 family protein
MLYVWVEQMKVTWDPLKARANLSKHDVRFSDAESVFFDPGALTREDEYAEGEQRFVSVGVDSFSRVLTVVYSHQGEDIRMISARQATRSERRAYEEGIRFQ